MNFRKQHSIEPTPLQLAHATGVIAASGKVYRPRLVSHIQDARDRSLKPVAAELMRSISIDPEHLRRVRDALVDVTRPGGTAAKAGQGAPYTFAGKTGTAQKVVDGTYSDTQYIASFVGFAPAADPRLLVAVIVDDPKGGDYYGGSVAAPAFGQIASFALPYLGIAPTE